MAQPARSSETERDLAARRLPPARPLGDVYGPVAEMHRTIEAKMRLEAPDADLAWPAPTPVEQALRRISRVFGWSALAGAFVAVALLIG